jgi:DNA invertase Pin-like site-specific DNA recombinase
MLGSAQRHDGEGGVRAVGYVRVSTAEQVDSGAGLAAQRAAIEAACAAKGWTLVGVCEDGGASGGSLTGRRGMAEALVMLGSGEADVVVAAKLDRFSRSVSDFAGLIEQAKRGGWALAALDVDIDMTTPTGELMATVIAAMAQYEHRLIGQRTRDALAARRAEGVRLGRPRSLPDEVVARIVARHAAGASQSAIARELDADAVPTAHGGRRWRQSSVAAVLQSFAGRAARA